MKQIRFGLIGAAWRAEFFLRLAQSMPDRFAVTGVVTRSPERAQRIEATFGVTTYRTTESMVTAEPPDFVVVAVPREVAPGTVVELVKKGIFVLLETPPAADVPTLRQLWSDVGASGLVQVAEQNMLMPANAARLKVIHQGRVGRISSCHISSTHLYHAVSMMRALLGVGFSEAVITARSFSARLSDPVGRNGWTGDNKESQANTTLAIIDFEGVSAFYDFTSNQWLNPLRLDRLIVRGSRGELSNDRVVHLSESGTAIASNLIRRQTGLELNLEGHDLDHISFEGSVVYRNPFQGARLADEEIAIASLLQKMGEWCHSGDGEGPYPLSEACQDQLLGLAIEEAADTGVDVRIRRESWA